VKPPASAAAGTAVAPGRDVLHVCLAGPGVATNQALRAALRTRHAVILIEEQARLHHSTVLDRMDLLVLDAGGIRAMLPWLLRSLRRRRPDLKIVLVDGGLTEHDKADAFTLGVLDYFPSSYQADLLAERLEVLGRSTVAPSSS
jgi:DNA-binding response OmpR family regulator